MNIHIHIHIYIYIYIYIYIPYQPINLSYMCIFLYFDINLPYTSFFWLLPHADDRIREIKWCDGNNGVIMLQIAQHPNWPTLCKLVGRAVRRMGSRRLKRLRLHLHCKAGYHRSVGAGNILQAFFEASGWQVESNHIAHQIRGGCGCPYQCRNANIEQRDRWILAGNEALDRAFARLEAEL